MEVYKLEDAVALPEGGFEFPVKAPPLTEPEARRTLIVTCYPIERLAEPGQIEHAAPMLKLAYSNAYRILHDRVIQGSDSRSYHFLIAVLVE